MRRLLLAALVVATASAVACGGDGKPDRSIAILRAVPIAKASEDVFLDELAKAGWKTGDNLDVLDPSSDEVHAETADAATTVHRWVDDGADVIVALSTSSAKAAADASGDVPVLTLANDPVASGLVRNARAPEGHVTGISFRVPPDRTIDLAARVVPRTTLLGLLWPSEDPAAEPVRAGLVAAAKSLGIELVAESFSGDGDVDGAVQRLALSGVQTVVLVNAPATLRSFDAIERATVAAKLPVVSNTNTCMFAVLVFAPDNGAAYRQLARQAARLLDGTSVMDVPVEDPGQFHLQLRAKVAARLGLDLPSELRAQADEVID